MPRLDRDTVNTIRLIYLNFKRGAELREEDVDEMLRSQGVILSKNALRCLGRDSHRGRPITPPELLALVRAWADMPPDDPEQ